MRTLAAALVLGLGLAACTSSDQHGAQRPPVTSGSPTQQASTPSAQTPSTQTPSDQKPGPPTLTAGAKNLPVGTRPALTELGTLTLPGVDGANPGVRIITDDGRLFVSHNVTEKERPERLRLNAVQLVEPRTGRKQTLTDGFPHKTQVIGADSQGPWVVWSEGDSIYPESVGWHLYSWNTRTGEHHHLASFHDLQHLRGTPQGDYTVALWHGRAWMVGAHRPADTQQALYSVPVTGGQLRREGNDEAAPFTAGNRLYTTRARTRNTILLQRARPGRQPTVVYQTNRPHAEVLPLGARLVSIYDTPTGQRADLIRPGRSPRTLLNAPSAAQYWLTGSSYLAFQLGRWPETLVIYDLRTHDAFRASHQGAAIAVGSDTDLLSWMPAAPIEAERDRVTTLRIDN